MKPTILLLNDPKVASLVLDQPAMQRWEVLRRSDVPMTAEQLATACHVHLSTMQFTLDRLVDAGFAVRLKASTASKRIRFRAASKDVVVRYDSTSESGREIARGVRDAMTQHGRKVVDRAQRSPGIRSKSLRLLDTAHTPVLTFEESIEVMNLLTSTARKVEEIEDRAYRHAIADPASNFQSRTRGYYVHLLLQPLAEPELPLPHLAILSEKGVASFVERMASAPGNLLSRRECEIARRLAAGDSRPAIAKALALSPDTVAATCKRIYAKLGVHSRAALAARMLEA